MTFRHGDQELGSITKPVFQVDGVRRVGPLPVYSTVALSLAESTAAEALAEHPQMTEYERESVAFVAMEAAALALGLDHPLRGEIIALRNRIA